MFSITVPNNRSSTSQIHIQRIMPKLVNLLLVKHHPHEATKYKADYLLTTGTLLKKQGTIQALQMRTRVNWPELN